MELDHQQDNGDVQVDVTLNELSSRYEGRLGDQVVAEIDFSIRGTTMIITHTGTRPALRGRGIAAQLTAFALSDARDRGMSVRPVCPYTADYIAQHPEYSDLLA